MNDVNRCVRVSCEVVIVMALALGCTSHGPSGASAERCDALCERAARFQLCAGAPSGPPIACPTQCANLSEVADACSTELDAYLSCLETVSDGAFCTSTSTPSDPCWASMQAIARCANAHDVMCQYFGTCVADHSTITTCVDHGSYQYRTGTRTFTCASSTDCTEAQHQLITFCGP